jgi:hypothetical protein
MAWCSTFTWAAIEYLVTILSKLVHLHEQPAAARVRARVWSCGICGGRSSAGAGFLRVLQFPLPIFIPPIAPQLPSSIIWGLYNRPEVATVPRDLVPPHQYMSSSKIACSCGSPAAIKMSRPLLAATNLGCYSLFFLFRIITKNTNCSYIIYTNLWGLYTNTIIVTGHYSSFYFYLNFTTFRRLIMSLFSGGTYSVGPNR